MGENSNGSIAFNFVENIDGMDRRIESLAHDDELSEISKEWIKKVGSHDYAYNFTWMGRPIIQVPQDMVAVQELIWRINPDLVIETGVARGGSIILSASMLALLDVCEAIRNCETMNPLESRRKVIGVDIEIREHNLKRINEHPMASRIKLLEGSSTAPEIIDEVREFAENHRTVLVVLDSNHTHEHVLSELELYAPLVSKNSYCIVFDTFIEDLPDEMLKTKPWGVGNNPKTAVREYLKLLKNEGRRDPYGNAVEFKVDVDIEKKLTITAAPEGYLKRI